MKQSEASILLYRHLRELFPNDDVNPEHRFITDRKFRFDFAVPYRRLACEIDGGLWIQGRHNRPIGASRDMEKFNLAAVMGWRVLRFTPQQVLKGEAREFIREWFCPALREFQEKS